MKPDASYRKAQSRLVNEAAASFAGVDCGREGSNARRVYDQQLRRSMPVDGKGRRPR